MSKKRHKEKTDKANADDDASKNTGQAPCEQMPAQTFDEYQCSGVVETDFNGLCALLGMTDIPVVSTKQPASSTTETEAEQTEDSKINAGPLWFKPCLQVELESEDPLSASKLKISGWKVDEQIDRVLQKMLLSLSKLRSLHFWKVGLTDQLVISLMNTIPLCSNISALTLEGNPLPEQSFHLLLCEHSPLTHLCLRNNRIGDEGARLIGSALSTTRSANKKLLSLNLAFNTIGDAGAKHIAQGLRLNRTLLSLSLSNNQIGDSGAAHLAVILGKFALTHVEVVERRKLLLERMQSASYRADSDQSPADQLPSVLSSTSLSSSKGENKTKKKEALKKDEKPAASKENPKASKKSSDIKVPQSKGGKLGNKEKQLSAQEDHLSASQNEQLEGRGNPLLDPRVQCSDGEVYLPGNTTLSSLNLAGNRITEKSLPLFLTSLEMQAEGGGLLHLCLQRNRFSAECEIYVKLKEQMSLRDLLEKNICDQTQEEGHGAKC